MAVEITVPRLGWSMEEGAFSGWLKQHGEHVAAGEPLFALESDKVTMDVESLDSGILHVPGDAPEAGAVVRVGQRLGYLLAPGEAVPAAAPPVSLPVAAAGLPLPLAQQTHRATEDHALSRRLITPRARRVAAELEVDTSSLTGTGRNGRIREADVRGAVSALQPVAAPVSALRRTIAARLLESHRNTVPVTLTTQADATRLVALRKHWQAAMPAPAPSYTDFAAKLAAVALAQHPALGGRWEHDRVVLPSASGIHVGIAVDTPQGLLVPVLRDVGATPLAELARRSRELIDAARTRRVSAMELTGAVFSITNLGGFGIDAFTPVINFPETAILGLGAIRRVPVVLEQSGEIAAQDRITLSLTFDHRVVDGAPAARFLQALVRLIEAPPQAVQP